MLIDLDKPRLIKTITEEHIEYSDGAIIKHDPNVVELFRDHGGIAKFIKDEMEWRKSIRETANGQ